ncbi:MAG TPA: DinB family protein [Rubrobacter sp.]|nr:DinB family protein [Rubrobacter sp.]
MTDPLARHFRMLAAYNRLANLRLYGSCARLGEAELKARRPSFFGSIYGTLNHVMVGDRIWLARFVGEDVPSTNLGAILYEGFGELWEARREEDARIEAFAAGIDEGFLDGEIGYVNNEGRSCLDPVDLLVAHFFNHQTHHRGQIHDMLSQTNVPPPVLDLHRVIRPSSPEDRTP